MVWIRYKNLSLYAEEKLSDDHHAIIHKKSHSLTILFSLFHQRSACFSPVCTPLLLLLIIYTNEISSTQK